MTMGFKINIMANDLGFHWHAFVCAQDGIQEE